MNLTLEPAIADDGMVVVAISGSIDLTTTPRLRDSLVRLVDEGHYRLVLEMSGVDLIDSIGLGAIVGMVHRLRPHDGSLAIAAASPQARTVLEITQLVRVVGCHDTVEAAADAVRSGAASLTSRRAPGEPAPAG